MSVFNLLRAELGYRKMNVSLTLSALIAAATLLVASPTLLDGYQSESRRQLDQMQEATEQELAALQRETEQQLDEMQVDADDNLIQLEKRTRRIMRDLGFNLRIVHRNTDLTRLYADYVAFEMPEEYVQRLADSPQITKIVHLVATLRQMIQWEGKDRLLVGFAPEATQSHIEQKAPMGYQIKRGAVYLGSVAGEGRMIGEQITILGKPFEIGRILPLHGNQEDIAICMHLKDAQEVLEKEGRISEILALGCKCETVERVEEITAELELVLPEARVTEMRLQAIAREDQRKLVEKHYAQLMEQHRAKRDSIVNQERKRLDDIVQREKAHRQHMLGLLSAVSTIMVPMIVLVCTIWVGLLAWSNVRERRSEIGLLRALGKGSSHIATLLLGKAFLLGLAAGIVGCLLGFVFAAQMGSRLLELPPSIFSMSPAALLGAIAGTPLIAAVASYLPTLSALRQDPAVVLME
jgi:putative ABC transport system permease protein